MFVLGIINVVITHGLQVTCTLVQYIILASAVTLFVLMVINNWFIIMVSDTPPPQ